MKIDHVCVLGGSGFVGRQLAGQLVERGAQVTVLTRDRERAKSLIVLPTIDVVECNVHDAQQLAQAFRDVDAVINLVGILHERRRGDFQFAHTELTRQILTACQTSGVQRYLHMSALAASEQAPSAYLRSKGAAESLVRAASAAATTRNPVHAQSPAATNATAGIAAQPVNALQTTVFRPSVIFGPGDSFLNLFAKLLKLLPVVLLACPNARFQPVYVEDVARAFAASLEDPATFGKSFDLCGPKIYTLRELIELVRATLGVNRMIVGLGDRLSYLQAWAMEFAPVKLMTRDNYHSMQVDNVCSCAFPPEFGIVPTALEAVVGDYLAGASPRDRYVGFRRRAGR